jgi:hypothetical protein
VFNGGATKIYDQVVIENNSIDSTDPVGILIDGSARAASFAFDSMVIENNWHKNVNSYDTVQFNSFPEYLTASRLTVSILVNPAGVNEDGVLTSLADAMSTTAKYKCQYLNIALDPAVTTTQTLTGPRNYDLTPVVTTIDGDNGASGRIRFYTAGTSQQNLSLINLEGNQIIFDGCIFNSDSGTSTTALIFGSGYGQIIAKDCTFQYGEYAVDTRGPDVSIRGGTIDDINLGNAGNRAIINVSSDRFVKCDIKDTTGANNTRLYYCVTPALFAYENISVGTTAGVKNFTLVT